MWDKNLGLEETRNQVLHESQPSLELAYDTLIVVMPSLSRAAVCLSPMSVHGIVLASEVLYGLAVRAIGSVDSRYLPTFI